MTESHLAEHRAVKIALIDVPSGRRALDPNWVEALAEDFKARGQRTPIELLQTGERYRLVTGGHRLAARLRNGDVTIDAIVKQWADFASEAEVKLAEIVENFMRRELSVLDRAFDVAAWRELFEAVKGTVQRGGDRKSSKFKSATLIGDDAMELASDRFAANFTVAAQKALGLSRDAVFRALKIARIGESIRQRIALHPIADNQSELLSLVAETPARQNAIVDRLLAGAVSVSDAIAILDNLPTPAPRMPWERMSEGFSRLKPAEQERFFEAHEDAIRLWMASR
ncbi:chromosome partitioning protein, ParB family [Devosia enhydra]|uniref:Chromosome partitioning protein, ParB family n=1 Tax=Devosia enhydra TaxID=665118 RepID=A0A1K2I2I1_9HYPH|nr:ParB N-terminal domain-containing protein [Devosia enhydra]SFZ85964.1 chromosome partitioning protein, ParB family [Devosia enhydra]